MRRILSRSTALLTSWAIGLLIAVWVVPGISVTAVGFVVAVAVFTLAEAILYMSIVTLPHVYATLLLGGVGLILTIGALVLASAAHGITIEGLATWLATTMVVWLVTTIGAITLPEFLGHNERSGSGRHA